jgi:transcriptional regulator with XRE-family HTH domain
LINIKLKLRVLESGKRQIQIAREIGVPEPYFSKIVGGWVEPCEELKRKIAQALGCGVEEVFSIPGEGMPDSIEVKRRRPSSF